MKKGLLLYAVAAMIAVSCQKDETFDGPALVDLYGDFAVLVDLDISDREVDFAAGEQTYFTCAFSKNVEWDLEIKGLTTGAVKHITGFGSALDATSATWNGTTTSLPMFRDEECAVALIIPSAQDTLRDTLTVLSGRVNTGLLLSDFEDGLNPGWVPFIQSGANMNFGILNAEQAAQGQRYYNMAGQVNWDWLIGMVDMPGSAYGDTHFALNDNPDVVYFNTFLYKPAEYNNGLVLFQFREDDNEDGMYSAGSEDMFSIQVQATQEGWQQITSKYADLATLVNGAPAAAIGNGLHEPHKLIQVSVLFLANPTSGYSESKLDYMIFTENAPLIP
jgi:hypothetical protein